MSNVFDILPIYMYNLYDLYILYNKVNTGELVLLLFQPLVSC